MSVSSLYKTVMLGFSAFKPTSELFFAEIRRSWIQLKRYPAEAIGGAFIFTAVFYGLFLGANYITGSSFKFGSRLDELVVGYVLWILVTFVLFDLAGTLQAEAQSGTLEQLFLSPYSAAKVFLIRAIAGLSVQFLLIAVIVSLLTLLTGRHLNFSPYIVLPLATILTGAYGLSLIVGSLVLIFKRIQQLFAIVQFGILFLLNTPLEEWNGVPKLLGWILPLSPGTGILRDLMVRGNGLNLSSLAIALVNGGVYLTIGLIAFDRAQQVIKRQGKLSGF